LRHQDPAAIADLSALLTRDGAPVAAAYDDGRQHWHGFDPAIGAALLPLRRALPEAGLELSMTRDGALWLVRAMHETWIEDRHFLYRPATAGLEQLFVADSPPPLPLAPLLPLHYRASDGRILHGYVLLPRGRDLREVPLIAWLHGGPAARETAQFDARLQLLANRGNAIFLPNFRGSDGFGMEYKLAANGDVGDGRVLRDVIEGLDLLLARGIGNAQQQAVMGHSFGGYLALVAHTHHPTRFRFAWAAAPPTDYGWTKEWQAKHDSPALRADARPLRLSFPLHGYRYEDPNWREAMRRQSPRANVERIRQPVYLWAGAQDTHVPLSSLAHYAGELGRLHKPTVMMVDPDAGHSPGESKGAEAYLYLMEAAAYRHLGSDLAPPEPDLLLRLRRMIRLGLADVQP
jgi:dipeptidyl aminopeptidase/acylaminoacyl peptidase